MNEAILRAIEFTIVGSLVARTQRIASTYHDVLVAMATIFSMNHKLWWSINLPAITCWPTPLCTRVCYAALLARSSRWIKTVRKLLRVHNYLLAVSAEVAADRIFRDYLRLPRQSRPPFIRVAGTGDLFLELVLAINVFVCKYPSVPVWVATRRPDMVALLDRNAASLAVIFSLDSSPESLDRMAQVLALGHPRVSFSYLRTTPRDQIPECVRVVYNLQQDRTLPTDDRADLCPADAGLVPMRGACAACGRCFSRGILTGGEGGR